MKNQRSKTALKIGEMIKFYRKRLHFSQKQLTKITGLAPGTISKIENQKNIPTIETVHKIATALKLNAKDLSLLLGINLYSTTE